MELALDADALGRDVERVDPVRVRLRYAVDALDDEVHLMDVERMDLVGVVLERPLLDGADVRDDRGRAVRVVRLAVEVESVGVFLEVYGVLGGRRRKGNAIESRAAQRERLAHARRRLLLRLVRPVRVVGQVSERDLRIGIARRSGQIALRHDWYRLR